MRKSIFILAISLLLPIVCCAQENSSTVSKSDIELIKILAEQGDADAQYELGKCYAEGEGGLPENLRETAFWWEKAAKQGNKDAQYGLGKLYYKGDGVAEDLKQAEYWLKKAAEQGHEDAKELLEEVEEEIQSLSASSSGQVYDIVEQMPSFPGGQSALFQYLSKNIQYPKLCEEHGIQGRVICSYIVEEDGSITDVQVRKSVHPSLDKEAVRVIQSMPKWNPGKENGLPVRVRYNLPITFSLK
jgi:TonB family protein